MTALSQESTSFHMVAAAPSGSESVDKACTTQLSLHRGAAPMKLTADSHRVGAALSRSVPAENVTKVSILALMYLSGARMLEPAVRNRIRTPTPPASVYE